MVFLKYHYIKLNDPIPLINGGKLFFNDMIRKNTNYEKKFIRDKNVKKRNLSILTT